MSFRCDLWSILIGLTTELFEGVIHEQLALKDNRQSLNCNPKSPMYYTLSYDMTGFL
jgi:hypothetical protein